MNKLLFLAFATITFSPILAMESDKPELSQEQKDQLGRELIDAIHRNELNTAINLIDQGANPNYMEKIENSRYNRSALMRVASIFPREESRAQVISIARKLIDNGANVNLISSLGSLNALMCSSYIEIDKFLIDAGINIYHKVPNRAPYYLSTALFQRTYGAYIFSANLILEKAIVLSILEKSSLKNWFLVKKRLQQEGRGVSKDISRLITFAIVNSLAKDLGENVLRAGANEAMQIAKNEQDGLLVNLINNYLNIDILRNIAEAQCAEEIRKIPYVSSVDKN